MILLAVFIAFFALGWLRARRAGGGLADRVRYGIVHGLAAALALYAFVTLGDWQGLTN
ncbi:hypothetical protein [Oceanicella actignis]|uniref:Uncharacterized protein n=1 Tax=Oceanicella actignis TaxID=1189325 RepID=A0A1M7RUM6_9RHOB|nr:hypothetical protein [Oceanicella actignis]SET02878.1 hypothetical protein SAMN04488119_102355 [Oceanicella actignis]SHN49975.1 hypothetical protein SAMN05216200_101163 [Oceanicella actignis]